MSKKLATTAQSVQPLATHTSLPAQHAQPTVNLTTAPSHGIPPLLRLPEVLKLIPVSRATWYAGMKDGRYPSPVKLGPRAVAWRSASILALTV